MNIAYTINGEGMGHATRSSVILDHLISRGHDITVFISGSRPFPFLQRKYQKVFEVTGFQIIYKDNRAQRLRTIRSAMSSALKVPRDRERITTAFSSTKPDVVITDFDFHGLLIARRYRVPLISIDNVQALVRSRIEVAAADYMDYSMNAIIARFMVPRADYFLISTFAPLEHRRAADAKKIFFVPPILRKKVMDRTASRGDHIVVYQTSDNYERLWSVLAQSSERFIAYHMQPSVAMKNIEVKEFSEDGFLDDLASAKAVIVNGGFNVITESLYFNKPILSIPVEHHYEQKFNGLMLTELGFGLALAQPTPKLLDAFFSQIDRFAERQRSVVFDNTAITSQLDELLVRVRR